MAITQEIVTEAEQSYKDLMQYNLTTHRLIPTKQLILNYGINIVVEAANDTLGEIDLKNISDLLYDFMLSNMPSENANIMYAKIAENQYSEQECIARAFGYLAHFIVSGGDATSHKSNVDLSTNTYIPPEVMNKLSIGLQVQRLLKNGVAGDGSEVWYEGKYHFKAEDITDLVFGVDY